MRLIDADAFIAFIKDTTRNHGYNTLEFNEYLTVSDVADAIVSDLDGTSLDGFRNAPTVDAIPIEWIESQIDKGKWAELVQRWAERKE